MRFSHDPHHGFIFGGLNPPHASPPTHPARSRLAGCSLTQADRVRGTNGRRGADSLRIHRGILAGSRDGILCGGEIAAAHRSHARL